MYGIKPLGHRLIASLTIARFSRDFPASQECLKASVTSISPSIMSKDETKGNRSLKISLTDSSYR